ncbi:hypothetical protein [Streptomyces sp. NPDC001833]|uniref:MmyB family transcriptional regulator n=1 Tax=Streptomyces sp. NPDC001833 TaxID=3154658 RepID=UPI003324D024
MGGARRAHLFTLAALVPPPAGPGPVKVDPLLERLVRELSPNPAYVMNPWWDALAYNDAYAELLGGLDRRSADERNILRIVFTESRGPGLFADWLGEARSLAGQLRVALARYPDDPRGPALLESLLDSSEAFRVLWDERNVNGFTSARKELRHPRLGRVDLDCLKLADARDEKLSLMVFLPARENGSD